MFSALQTRQALCWTEQKSHYDGLSVSLRRARQPTSRCQDGSRSQHGTRKCLSLTTSTDSQLHFQRLLFHPTIHLLKQWPAVLLVMRQLQVLETYSLRLLVVRLAALPPTSYLDSHAQVFSTLR